MKNKKIKLCLLVLGGSLLFGSCSNPSDSSYKNNETINKDYDNAILSTEESKEKEKEESTNLEENEKNI